MKKNNYLYEEMMQDIAVIVKHRINEAYDNQLLEEYGAKDIFNDVMKEATKEGKIFYTHLKKFIIYVIKKLQETNKYKQAEKMMNAYVQKIQKYINEHKKITPRRMLKITVTVLAIYGGVSMVQDCKSLIKSLQNNVETYEQTTEDIPDTQQENITVDEPEDFVIDVKDEAKQALSVKHVSQKDINNSPANKFEHDKNFNFKSSDSAREFIKKHEMLLLYPYYANESEEKQGKVTIGYGHVVLETDGALYQQIQQLKKKGLIKQSFTRDKKTGKLILNPKHCKPIITKAQANKLFLKDIKIAEDRAYKALQDMPTDDDNVKCYMLYNQKIRDGLTSLCYNAGNLKHDKYSFITKGLAKCRYDYKNQKINSGDYNVSFSYFKNIKDNPNRRNEEYKLFFMNANKSMS